MQPSPTTVAHSGPYADQIREQIEREVRELKVQHGIGPHQTATIVELGYWVNSHRGRPLYSNGDQIAGLTVQIIRDNSRTIRVTNGKARDDNVQQSRW